MAKIKYEYDTSVVDLSRTPSVKLRYYDGKYVTDFTSMSTGFQWSGNKTDAFRCLAIDLVMGADVNESRFLAGCRATNPPVYGKRRIISWCGRRG